MAKKKEEETETTLDLDEIMEEGMERFEGELEPPSTELKTGGEKAAQEDETITPDAVDKEKSPPEAQSAESREQGAEEEGQRLEKPEHPVEEGAEPDKEGAEKAGEEEPAKKPEFRFKSQEESERGYRELQGKTTRLEQKNKELEQELKEQEAVEKQKAELQKIDEEFLEFSQKRHQEALAAIDDLDPDDAEYQADVSRVWAEKDRDIRQYDRELMKRVEISPQPPRSEGETEEDEGMAYVDQEATAARIDPKDEFYRLACLTTPEKDETGKPMSFKEQVAWAIKRTQDYHNGQEQKYQEKQKADAEQQSRTNQRKELPMGRSGAERPGETKAPVIVTLNDALEENYEAGRI